jgi:hypothetical protein
MDQAMLIPELSVSNLAEQALEACGGEVAKAAKYLENQARQNTSIWIEVTKHLISKGCYDAIRQQCHAERRKIWYSPNYSSGGNGDRVVTHANSLMDWPLPGGMKLRYATKEDLWKAASFYQKQADQMATVATWLTNIMNKVGRKTVGESLTEKQLINLREGVNHE